MLEATSRRMRGGCMMVMQRHGEDVLFRGTAFLVHPEGYLLTASDVVRDTPDLMVVPETAGDGFAPMIQQSVTPLAASVARTDEDRNVALLKVGAPLEIVVPNDLLGRPDEVPPGRLVLALGYSYGHQRVHGLMGAAAVVSSKARSRNGTHLFLYDKPALPGDIGGPLVDYEDGRVVGIIGGSFDPQEVSGGSGDTPPHHSFAVSVAYGAALLEAEGVVSA